ncbi:hypothetical protein [Nostoc sp. 'Peltigera malacea cyanobiont' DB3992]|uniref:hypothetical protein n=1 Tax=Nostoc sp. 'Peltigera malacea cyanobiont' DB3992 TaxID=1206980 RepID=UPI000C043B0F|nr:hypothetical protein [Nostoc sp. 'Peltigera malacea cyanobiont' DB3992]PHM07764.1 hypothetical protein CK516_25010 [Nostoc sp. 'Peltigera malacea cyanobiont' DB3992]
MTSHQNDILALYQICLREFIKQDNLELRKQIENFIENLLKTSVINSYQYKHAMMQLENQINYINQSENIEKLISSKHNQIISSKKFLDKLDSL